MTTTILKIYGLDIEFSSTPPTRAGAYWWTHLDPDIQATGTALLRVISNNPKEFWHLQLGSLPSYPNELWSAPLVPVTEVERAHEEGWYDSAHVKREHVVPAWNASRAKRVVEGLE